MIDERDRDRFYRNILSATFPRLMPADRQKPGCITDKFLDLIVEYGMPLKQVEPQIGNTFTGWASLTESFADEYKIPINIIRRESGKNLTANTKAQSFLQVAEQMGCQMPPEAVSELQEAMVPPYLILRIEGDEYGAAAVLDGVLMEMLALEYRSDLYVLFSSIWEAMVMPVNAGMPADEIRNMHELIQKSEVEENERLSDNVYLYSRESHTISIIGGDPHDPDNRYQYR
ncbi:hypothetical protein EI53_01872 [Fusobacterium naviforme]|nr:hypothetical protein F7P78_06885 [Fusobacterium naviforme]PSL09088.1 hypothetical protein EI53_01872 [Fusobacterium naviforme]STO27728.1 Uncharacterised protein [Fusobacterium naviforme]